tara:strand:+ start:8783 stop:9613 length:831 start_codon:yes stop_codon:yes gene_type:complete
MESVVGDECFKKLDLTQHVLFYFAAGWCKPCQESAPVVEKLFKEYDTNKIKFFKVDMVNEDNREFIEKCDVNSIPSFILFKDRNYIERIVGADIEGIKNLINFNVLGEGVNKIVHNIVPQPQPQPEIKEPEVKEPEIKDFYPNNTFKGEYQGFVYKKGEKGLGYYREEGVKGERGGSGGVEVHMVYGGWCGHSRNALPAFEELVKVTDVQTSKGSPVKFVLTEDKSEGMKRFREGEPKVTGFPTYMVVKPDDTMEVLQGHDRTKDSIITAVKKLTV